MSDKELKKRAEEILEEERKMLRRAKAAGYPVNSLLLNPDPEIQNELVEIQVKELKRFRRALSRKFFNK